MPIPTKQQRTERLAVSVFDLDRLPPDVRRQMLGGKLDLRAVVRPDPDKPATTALAFSCPLLEAALICDILRNNDRKLGDEPTKVYLYSGRGWAEIGPSTVLTSTDGGDLSLCPSVFPPLEEPTPPKFRPSGLGRPVT